MSRLILVLGLVLAVGAAGACGTAEDAAPESAPVEPAAPAEPAVPAAQSMADSPLAGTTWQLINFTSMDDAIGTIAPEDPAQFTLTLNADGTAMAQLGCNRGTGTWTAEASAEESGTFGFGPMAMTRAACPPPNLDERFARDSEFVRSYLIREGNLHLSLMADGGIWAWAPSTPPADAAAGGSH